MSSKLDQSLDTIMGERKPTGGPKRGGRVRQARRAPGPAAKATTTTPVGGIRKNARTGKVTTVTGVPIAVPTQGDSKIIISNLPLDVTETMLKDFFGAKIGSTKKILLSYGPNGRSRGEASVTFSRPDSAIKAHKEYNNVVVDTRPMKIEIVSATVPTLQPTKALQDRMAKPKGAAKEKPKPVAPKGPARGTTGDATRGGKTSGRAGRPKAKTAEELDAEMQDYFGGDSAAAPVNGDSATDGAAAQPSAATNGGDTGMDEIS